MRILFCSIPDAILYILQGLLGYLWDIGEVNETTIRTAARRFVRDRDGTFRRWLETFRKEGCALYQALLDNKLQGPPDINALTILSYHGVIDESEPDQPQISSTIFREWFRANHKVEKSAGIGVLEPPPTAAHREPCICGAWEKQADKSCAVYFLTNARARTTGVDRSCRSYQQSGTAHQ
ncbi:MAG: helix-turn-helix domain-containing protein [Bryobacteraceae bacterium]